MKKIHKRLTYANVMSSLAVFLVLAGGTAFAAGLAKNSVGPNQLKKNAVTTAKIKNGAVKASKLAPGPVPNATDSVNAQNLTGLFTAVVDSTGALVRGTSGVTVKQISTGAFLVGLPGVAEISNCTYTGSLGGTSSGVVAGQISLNNGVAPNQNAVFVVTQDSTGTPSNKSFSLIARC